MFMYTYSDFLKYAFPLMTYVRYIRVQTICLDPVCISALYASVAAPTIQPPSLVFDLKFRFMVPTAACRNPLNAMCTRLDREQD